jgi:D-threonate/D-erythronate kinase
LSTSGSNRTCIIADDLTGACDAAAAFARRGAATTVLVHPSQAGSGTQVHALCTETRNVAPELAIRRIKSFARDLEADPTTEIFKKIDSVFRGNTIVEISACLQSLPQLFAVIAPAFPALGRTHTDGMLHLHDLTGSQSIPIREQLHNHGIEPSWLPPSRDVGVLETGMRAALLSGSNAVFCEAMSDEELRTIVDAATALDRGVLWIGSAGLAHALAAKKYPDVQQPAPRHSPDGVLLAFTGSDHPVSEQQLAVLREQHHLLEWPSTTETRLAAPIMLLRIERGRTTEAQIYESVSSLDPETVGCLLMNGGDTALHVCRALGIHSIQIREEFQPGVPIGTLRGGRFDGCTVILKSGGFGDAGLLSRIARQSASLKEVTT